MLQELHADKVSTQGARSSVVNGPFTGSKERRSFKPKVASSILVGRIGGDSGDLPFLWWMAMQLNDALSAAALNERERLIVERFLGRLREEVGDDLLAVWLYGSRARGEADPTETDPDRRSDVRPAGDRGGR